MVKSDEKRLKFSDENIKKIEWLKTRYPTNRAALLPALHLAQEQFGWVSREAMDLVAQALDLPAIWVYEATTFYTLYHREKPGKNVIYLCRNVACYLRGCDDLIAHAKEKLGIDVDQTTADGRYTLKTAECLANCENAPAGQVNDDYVGLLTKEGFDKLVEGLP